MSKLESVLIQCTLCSATASYNIHTTVNATLDPEIGRRVANGSFFSLQCSACRRYFDYATDLLYNDMESKFWIWLKHPEKSGIPTLAPEVVKLFQILDGYKSRLVADRNDLMEKVNIFNDDLDDIAVETAKLMFSMANDVDLSASFYYGGIKKSWLGKKSLTFGYLNRKNCEEVIDIEFNKIFEMNKSILPKIVQALSNRWGQWLWVTRSTILEALEDSGIAYRETGSN